MSLFEHYPVSAASVEASAAALQASAKPIAALSSLVSSTHAPAPATVSGILHPPLQTAVKPVQTKAKSIEEAAVFAAGCVRYWADAITKYDTGIDALNTQFDNAEASSFGLHGPSLFDALLHGTLDQYRKDEKVFQGQVASARTALIAELTRQKNTLADTLDTEAAEASSLLKGGPTDSSVLELFQAGVLPLSAINSFPGVDFSKLDFTAMLARLSALGRQIYVKPGLGQNSDELLAELTLLRNAKIPPSQYRDLLQRYLLVKSCENAGIDINGWDPSLGADAMKPYLLASYAYYAKLYKDNPNLQWAGMAAMIGPTFAAGMFDLRTLRTMAGAVGHPLGKVPSWLLDPLLPQPIKDLSILANMSEGEFAWYETKLLTMQKSIFTDQMPMHEAYNEMGMAGIKEMRDAGLIPEDIADAWSQIDYGSSHHDLASVEAGNTALQLREQRDIIGADYNDMRNHNGPEGQAVTYGLGAIGSPGIPGAKTLAQYDPLSFGGTVSVPLPWLPDPHGSLDVKTGLPAGNISNFDTRWDLITNDTLPAFQHLAEMDPTRTQQILSTDVQQRIDDSRMVSVQGIDNDVKAMERLLHIEVDVEVGIG
ncbi:MAG: hypothetical protein QOK15_2868 [Nocardioidaceae bacterium]|nr:hypothetical protein [Nocardioidaceae bacterium]